MSVIIKVIKTSSDPRLISAWRAITGCCTDVLYSRTKDGDYFGPHILLMCQAQEMASPDIITFSIEKPTAYPLLGLSKSIEPLCSYQTLLIIHLLNSFNFVKRFNA